MRIFDVCGNSADMQVASFSSKPTSECVELGSTINNSGVGACVLPCDEKVLRASSRQLVAYTTEEINERTMAYVGKITKAALAKLLAHNVPYIYSEFPGERMLLKTVELSHTPIEIINGMLEDANCSIRHTVTEMWKHKRFINDMSLYRALDQDSTSLPLVCFQPWHFGYKNAPNTKQLLATMRKHGLIELSPYLATILSIVDGPHSRLHQYTIMQQPVDHSILTFQRQEEFDTLDIRKIYETTRWKTHCSIVCTLDTQRLND